MDVVKVLNKFGYQVLRHKKHIVLRHDTTGKRVVIPNHPEIKKGTLDSILKQANISQKEFIEAL